ncbi:hypothetical protein M426DRAFT_318698 [Hypoxylon sp. CI-4A]|nr:hypothetical protein M426DRAFT_318698 [Hypoxylon sp. CI-4A]
MAPFSNLPRYKPRGIANTETKQPDRFEWFNIGQDGLTGAGSLQNLPPMLQSKSPLLESFLRNGQAILQLINYVLASQLGLPPGIFTAMQHPETPSASVVRLIKSFASREPDEMRTSMIHHTDIGAMSIFANVLGGLQILAPDGDPLDDGAWLWVPPQPGCMVVNLGDAMAQWTGELLRSNVHRIRYAPGQQSFFDRYSLGILVRPEREAPMKRLVGEGGDPEGDELLCWEWEMERSMALREKRETVRSRGGRPYTGTPMEF